VRTIGFTLMLLAVLMFIGCGSLPKGGDLSPGTAGGAATATGAFGAQTVGGDQGSGQTPQTGTTGTATQNWNFAAEGNGSVQLALIEALVQLMAKPEEIVAAMKALNGAPENVTISVSDITIQSGSGEQTGSTAGTGSMTGTGRTVSIPDNR